MAINFFGESATPPEGDGGGEVDPKAITDLVAKIVGSLAIHLKRDDREKVIELLDFLRDGTLKCPLPETAEMLAQIAYLAAVQLNTLADNDLLKGDPNNPE